MNLIIYEGVMCCSTGVCGPEPDKVLIDLNQSLKKLQDEFKEMNVIRASMTFNLKLFFENEMISRLIKENGPGILPITTINGKIVARQKYLTYAELKKEVENSQSRIE